MSLRVSLKVHRCAGVLITRSPRKPYSNQREQEDDDNFAQRSKDADNQDRLGNEDQDQQGNQHFEDEDDQKEKDDDDEELKFPVKSLATSCEVVPSDSF